MDDFACDCSVSPYDHDGPTVCTTRTRRARKPHRCCECGEEIRPGEQYEAVRGLWEGYWDSYATCLTCVRIRRDYCPCGWIYGGLRETLMECIGLDYLEIPEVDSA